jgi:hypothetical protein
LRLIAVTLDQVRFFRIDFHFSFLNEPNVIASRFATSRTYSEIGSASGLGQAILRSIQDINISKGPICEAMSVVPNDTSPFVKLKLEDCVF